MDFWRSFVKHARPQYLNTYLKISISRLKARSPRRRQLGIRANPPKTTFHVIECALCILSREDRRGGVSGPVWNDFVIVLTWWHAALRVLTADKHDKAELRFMEGPCSILATYSGDGSLCLTAVTDSARGKIRGSSSTVSVQQLLNEIREACQQTAATCKAAGITSRDVDELRRISVSAS